MIRFFTRKGTLNLQHTLTEGEQESQQFSGNIVELLKTLKDCPSYQIDGNHRHCGLRTRFVPLLDSIDPWYQVGVCLGCWEKDRSKESWLEGPMQEAWQPGLPRSSGPLPRCGIDHTRIKQMHTATKRNWTPSVDRINQLARAVTLK